VVKPHSNTLITQNYYEGEHLRVHVQYELGSLAYGVG